MTWTTTLLLCAAGAAYGAPVEQVNISGSAGHSTLASAIAAVSDNGEIQIVEAGTYRGTVVLIGGKTYTIRGTVPGVIVANSNGEALVATEAPPTGAVNVTFDNVTIDRNQSADGTGLIPTVGSNTGAAMNIDQSASFPVTITLINNSSVIHSGPGLVSPPVSIDAGEAIKFNLGVVAGAPITFSMTGGVVSTTATQSNNKATIRQQGTVPIDGLTASFTNVNINTAGRSLVNVASGGNNHDWTFDGCTMTNTNITQVNYGRGIEFTGFPGGNSKFTFVDTSITCFEEVFRAPDLAAITGAEITFNRCVLDNSAGTRSDRTLDIRFADATASNEVNVFNSVIKSQQGTGSAARGFYTEGSTGRAYHTTFIAAGTGGERAINSANSSVTSWANCVFVNFLGSTSQIVGGGGLDPREGNAIGGPTDSTVLGADRFYTATIGDLLLDSNGKQSAGSPVIAQGTANAAIATAIGAVDIEGNIRPNNGVLKPDAGAYQFGTYSDARQWQLYY